jgi:lantibiotic modifying enzyme
VSFSRPGIPATPHFGFGRWPRGQLYAIIAQYRNDGRSPDWIHRKLGVSVSLIEQAFSYFEEEELDQELDELLDRTLHE